MTIAGYATSSPRFTIEPLSGPIGLTSKIMEERLLQFEYVDEPKKKPTVTLQFDNYDGRIVNVGVLIAGLKLRIAFGYDGLMSKPFDVVVVKIKGIPIRSPRSVSPVPDTMGVVQMTCCVETPKLKLKDPSDLGNFINMTAPEIARAIANYYNFPQNKIEIQTKTSKGEPFPKISSAAILATETAEDFLYRLAAEYGFEFSTAKGVFHFHSEDFTPTTCEEIEYFYGPDILSFEIDGDFKINTTQVTTIAHNPLDRRPTKYIISAEGDVSGVFQTEALKREVVRKEDKIAVISEKKEIRALARMHKTIRRRWGVKLTLLGNPKVFRHTRIDLYNFDAAINGLWFVLSCRHVYDGSGLTTTLLLKGHDSKHVRNKGLSEVKYIFNANGEISGVFEVTDKSVDEINKIKSRRRSSKKGKKAAQASSPNAVPLDPGNRDPPYGVGRINAPAYPAPPTKGYNRPQGK